MKMYNQSIPLNCVDKCLLAMDSIGETMLIHAILHLEGYMDHLRLNQAILEAQEIHPITRTILKGKSFGLYREIQPVFEKKVLQFQELDAIPQTDYESFLREWLNKPMDIREGFPVRVLLLKKKESAYTIAFTFHHSATDGLRAILFIKTVLENYNSEINERPKTSDVARISFNGDELLDFARRQRPKVRYYYWRMFFNLFHRFILTAFPPPTRVYHDKSERSKELDICFNTIEVIESEKLVLKTRTAGVELNDLLLAACYRHIEKWNSMHGRSSKRIRIMAPVNISPKGFRNVISNQASWISPWTNPKDRSDPIKLLKKVRTDSINAARNRIAFSLVFFFYFCSLFPISIMKIMCHFLITTRTYVDSILITNIGLIWPQLGSEEPVLTKVGNAQITNITGSAPVVTPMGLSFCAGIYNKSLNISLTYRPSLFSREKAQEFLDRFIEEILNYPMDTESS